MSKAADELAVAQGAVSRSIQVLEEDLGAVLFKRTRPFLTRTDAGDALDAEVKLGFERWRTAWRVQALAGIGTACHRCPAHFRDPVPHPAVEPAPALLPALDVDLTVSEKTIDFDIDPVDIPSDTGSIGGGRQRPRSAHAGGAGFGVCAGSPCKLRKRFLATHDRSQTAASSYDPFRRLGGLVRSRATEPVSLPGLGLEHFIMVIEAAVSGARFCLAAAFHDPERAERRHARDRIHANPATPAGVLRAFRSGASFRHADRSLCAVVAVGGSPARHRRHNTQLKTLTQRESIVLSKTHIADGC